MTLPFAKPIAVIGLVQIVVCFIGFFALAVVMKLQGYPDVMSKWNYFSEKALWGRNWGMIMVIVPIIWTFVASWNYENPASEIPLKVHLIFGFIFTSLVTFYWFAAITDARLRWHIIISV